MLNRRDILRASAFNGFGFVIASAVTIVWWLLVTRLYPAEESGRLILAISAAGVINLLDLGVSLGVVSLVSAHQTAPHPQADPSAVFKVALTLILLLEAVAGAGGLAIWLGDHPNEKFLTSPVAGLVLGFALSTQALQLCTGLLKGLIRFRAANFISTGSTIMVYGSGAIQIYRGADTKQILALMTAVQIGAAALSVRYALRQATRRHAQNTDQSVLQIVHLVLSASLRFYPQMFTGIFFTHIQRFLIVRFIGLDAVAILSLAFSIASRLHAICNAFIEVLFPIARHMKKGGSEILPFCVRTGATAALSYAGVASIVGVSANWGMPALTVPFGLFAVGVACSVAVAPTFHVMNGTGRSWQVSLASAISPLTFLAFAFMLHSLGAISGGILVPLSYSIASVVMAFQIYISLLGLARKERVAA